MSESSVLFICYGNTCRSPMAEAIARALGRGAVESASAGLTPTGRVVANTSAALDALGYSSEGLRSKGLDEVEADSFDVVVSLIGGEGLRFLPQGISARLEAWSIQDPYGEDEEIYLAVAKDLEGRVRRLLEGMLEGELSIS